MERAHTGTANRDVLDETVVLSAIRLLSSMAEIVGAAEWMSTQMSPPKSGVEIAPTPRHGRN